MMPPGGELHIYDIKLVINGVCDLQYTKTEMRRWNDKNGYSCKNCLVSSRKLSFDPIFLLIILLLEGTLVKSLDSWPSIIR